MAKSYKNETMQLLQNYLNSVINVGAKEIPVYSYNLQEVCHI